jgi:hypothetical protein
MGPATRQRAHAGEPQSRTRNRRQRFRRSFPRRLLQPIWYEICSMLRNSLYRWSVVGAFSVGLLLWLAGILFPSSDPERFRQGTGSDRRVESSIGNLMSGPR